MTDPIIEAVRKDLHDRSQVGIKKYGTTLAENICKHRAKLQHAYEEALDMANYLKWAIMELDAEVGPFLRPIEPCGHMGCDKMQYEINQGFICENGHFVNHGN